MRPSLALLIGPVLLVPLVACVPPTYQVQRSVRAPHASVPLRTGQPLTGPVELTVGASNLVDLMKPKVGDAQDAVEVPAHQARGELRIRLGERGELALIHERGLGGSAVKLDPAQAPIGDGSPHGTGAALRYAIQVDQADSKLVIGIEGELLSWSLPYVEFRTCVANCPGGPLTMIDRGTANEVTVGVGITPSYQLGKLTLFGGGFAREHPTIERKGTEHSSNNDEDVRDGRLNLMLHAGAGYRFDKHVSAILLIHQNVTRDPVHYGPGIGLALSATMH